MGNLTQEQHFYKSAKITAEINGTWMEILKSDPPTRQEFDKLVEKRPSLWKRFENFRDQLPETRN